MLYLLFCLQCAGPGEATIEETGSGRLVAYRSMELTGRRDGDRLDARLAFETASSPLVLDLRFRIGVPTRLESGYYEWPGRGLRGPVRAGSVLFLGGQSDNPNLGAVLELLSEDGTPVCRVTLPTSEVRRPRAGGPSMAPSH